MALFLLIVFVMLNFAANSVLSRAGIFNFGMDALLFSGVRLASGAVTLVGLVAWRGGWPRFDRRRISAAVYLLVYLVPFSLAYLTLPSGVGALILFGVVQITMFAGSALTSLRPTPRQWAGMTMAMSGLAWLLWPREAVVFDPAGIAFMAVAGIGWGLFSLLGRTSTDPLGDMAWSFAICLPAAIGLMLAGGGWTAAGVAVATLCGAVTSGLGYALWYRVLPQIAATTGAVAQLSVPVIALLAGAMLLGEAITLQIALASAIVLGGIAVAVIKR